MANRLELLRLSERFLGTVPLGHLRCQPVIGGGEAARPFGDELFKLLAAACQSLARLDNVGYVSAGAKPSDDPITVADILATLMARGGVWAAELAPGRAVRVAVNYAMTSRDAPVHPGDEVALFPPVTGG